MLTLLSVQARNRSIIFRNTLVAPDENYKVIAKNNSTLTTQQPKTGIVMLNMGGPQNLEQVEGYLSRLMGDQDIIQLPFQSVIGPWMARRRTDETKQKYVDIGGSSPILAWSEKQGEMLCRLLDKVNPDTAPHKHYVAFRYVNPMTGDVLQRLEQDGVENAVIFSQYPHYSCATAGTCFNAIADHYSNKTPPKGIRFSIIDRWSDHPMLAQVFAERIKEKLERFPEDIRRDVIIMFSAHSLPLKVISNGSLYPHDVATSVTSVMAASGLSNKCNLVWQPKVGPWLQPYAEDMITAYVKEGKKNFIVVPITHTTEHIETLHEMDIKICDNLAKKIGVQQIERASAPNDHPLFIEALADIVKSHLTDGPRLSEQFLNRCPKCSTPRCENVRRWYSELCSTPIQETSLP